MRDVRETRITQAFTVAPDFASGALRSDMKRWKLYAVVLLILAIAAGVIGFKIAVAMVAAVARVFFFLLLVLLLYVLIRRQFSDDK